MTVPVVGGQSVFRRVTEPSGVLTFLNFHAQKLPLRQFVVSNGRAGIKFHPPRTRSFPLQCNNTNMCSSLFSFSSSSSLLLFRFVLLLILTAEFSIGMLLNGEFPATKSDFPPVQLLIVDGEGLVGAMPPSRHEKQIW